MCGMFQRVDPSLPAAALPVAAMAVSTAASTASVVDSGRTVDQVVCREMWTLVPAGTRTVRSSRPKISSGMCVTASRDACGGDADPGSCPY